MAKSMLGRRSRMPSLPFQKKSKVPSVVGPLAGAAASFGLSKVMAGKARQGKEKLEKGKETVGQGKDVVEKANDLSDKISSAASAASQRKTKVGKVAAAVTELAKSGDNEGTADTKLRHIIQEYIIVGVPRETAYNQWTQFKEFPKVMKAVQQADQKDDEEDQTTWSVKIGPSSRQWEAEITEQVPDERIVWKATGGANNWGVVTFHSLDENLTRVMVQMEYHPTGFIEKTGNLLRIQRRRVRRELRLFKHFLEIPGQETGGWRGEIDKDEEEQPKAGKEQEEEQKKQLQSDKDEKKAKKDEDDSESDDDAKASSNGRSKKRSSSSSKDDDNQNDDEEEWVPIQERGKEHEEEKASS